MPELTDELVAVIPASEYVHAVVREHERGLHYVQGRLVTVLEPGRYAFWTHPEAQVDVNAIDMRAQQVAIAGQELMTRDKVTLRLTLTVEYAVERPGADGAHASPTCATRSTCSCSSPRASTWPASRSTSCSRGATR